MGVVDELDEILHRAELRQDLAEIADVIPAVLERRIVERRQPDAVDPQPLQVIQLLGHALERAGAVAVRVVEGTDQHLVEHRVLVPLMVRALPRIVTRGRGRSLVGLGLRLHDVAFGVHLRTGTGRLRLRVRQGAGGQAGVGRLGGVGGGVESGIVGIGVHRGLRGVVGHGFQSKEPTRAVQRAGRAYR